MTEKRKRKHRLKVYCTVPVPTCGPLRGPYKICKCEDKQLPYKIYFVTAGSYNCLPLANWGGSTVWTQARHAGHSNPSPGIRSLHARLTHLPNWLKMYKLSYLLVATVVFAGNMVIGKRQFNINRWVLFAGYQIPRASDIYFWSNNRTFFPPYSTAFFVYPIFTVNWRYLEYAVLQIRMQLQKPNLQTQV